MPKSIRQNMLAPLLPQIAADDFSQIDPMDDSTWGWKDHAWDIGRIALHVASASAAHFAAGFVAGEGALTAYGATTEIFLDDTRKRDAGWLIGTVAAAYGAGLGMARAHGLVTIREMSASLLSLVVAGMVFPLGGLLGGHSVLRIRGLIAPHVPESTDMAAAAARGTFAEGAERGAVLAAIVGYAACRWVLKKAASKSKIDTVPMDTSSEVCKARRNWSHGAGAGNKQAL